MNVEDVVAFYKAQRPSGEDAARAARTAKHLAIVWRDAMRTRSPGSFVPDLTRRERGQLRHLLNRCPDGSAGSVLRACVLDWDGFLEHVRRREGGRLPERPAVGSVLRYVASAVEFAGGKKEGKKRREWKRR